MTGVVLALLACSHEEPVGLEVDASTGTNDVNLTVSAPFAAALTGTCTLADDAAEVHVFSAEPAADHSVTLRGLLAASAYLCSVEAGDLAAEIEIRTEALDDGVPDTLALTTDDGADDGYTLFNHLIGDRFEAPGRLVIVDREGRVRWVWEFPHYGGDVDASLTPDGLILVGGGYGMAPTLVDLAGEIVYEASEPLGGGRWHHHVRLGPSGTWWGLAEEDNVSPANPDLVFTGFRIEERDPATDTTMWSWSSQSAVDAGTLPTGTSPGEDVFHANAIIAENPADPEGVWVSLRNVNSLLRIDRNTGEVTWRMSQQTSDWTLLTDDGSPTPAEAWFFGQHAPELHDSTLYVYDNGTGRPNGSFSRIAAFELDFEARTLDLAWEWTEDVWYEPIWGDVDLLDDGRVLVTKAHCNDCGAAESPTSWLVLDPDDGPTWRLDAPTLDHGAYRAQRIDGCSVFANTAYCPG